MKIHLPCMKCSRLSHFMTLTWFEGQHLPDSGIMEGTCNQGHHTFAIVQQTKFEVLSQFAIKAISDDYYRDAIASFSASLERLYELFVRAICCKFGIEQIEFDGTWKYVKNQSERQLGMFVAAFLLEMKTTPKLLSDEFISLRNNVIHKGRLPDRAEAVSFGQAVVECAVPLLEIFRLEPYDKVVVEMVSRETSSRAKSVGGVAATYSLNTFFNIGRYTGQKLDVETAVMEYVKRPDFLRHIL